MKFFSIFFLLFSANVIANNKSICGVDDRVPSTEPQIARALGSMSDSGGCTVTMISSSCAISAGHCKSVLGIAEFNTPPSRGGRIQHPDQKDIYNIDKSSIKQIYSGLGDDWAVMKIKPNTITGLLPGNAQGHLTVSFDKPLVGDEVMITGYGLDRMDPVRNLAQQTHSGKIVSMNGSVMNHNADTMGGNSGSSIVNMRTGKVIAIHTNGGCSSRGGSNASTMISKNLKLTNAIKACLASE